MVELNENLIVLGLEAPDAQSVIEILAGRLYAQGLVSSEYGQQTFAREQKHPTGLPTTPFCIAFPHAEADGVRSSALAVASLHSPVLFKNMADPEEDLQVYLVLMLANKKPEEQIRTLRNLALIFGQPEKLTALRGQPTVADTAAWLKRELGLNGSGGSAE